MRWIRRAALAAVALLTLLVGAGSFIVAQSKVPPLAIATSVTRTPALVERAWSLPVASTFGREIAWQSNGSRCGPASLANVFRSLGQPQSTEAAVLAGTGKCWTGVCIMGLGLDELEQVARTHAKGKVTVLRDLTPEAFREHMQRSNDPTRRYVVNFDRGKIFGAGVGHHAPIGGYLEDLDMVFVLDPNEAFKPWLVERQRLYEAVNTEDGELRRGLLLIEQPAPG